MRSLLAPALLALALALTPACAADPAPAEPPRLASGDRLDLVILLPADAGPGLDLAAADLLAAARAITGATGGAVTHDPSATAPALVRVTVDPALDADLGPQGYRLAPAASALAVTAATDVGAMYALYDVAAALGARYHHPEETFFPRDPAARLPLPDAPRAERPHFRLRGFHEHTQHPIPMSDFFLRPDLPDARAYASRYLRWLARNRQNVASFHLLKTVDLDPWLPWIADVIDEAHTLGVRVGMVLSFVDQQQNNFKILLDGSPDDDATQIRAVLTRLAAAGFDFFAFQIGSSEFTKPPDDRVLAWLDTVAADAPAHLELFAWIHTTCDLEADDGTRFFHLPGRAPARLGAWAHTTMFYDLDHPAPVYACDDFRGQRDFIAAQHDQRAVVYFPETAWWLGFDNTVPLALPITGWTREHDVLRQLADFAIDGHVTFTTGREWGYWAYDHYLTRVTWDGATTWRAYLDWLAPALGPHGPALASVLDDWTALQRAHFFADDPLIYFYLAGELPQDEVGAQAGVLARRPKLAFTRVLAFDDAAHDAWRASDLALLAAMRDAHDALLADLPPPGAPAPSGLPNLQDALYAEAHDTLTLYALRLRHALALYEGVSAARAWDRERDAADPDPTVRAEALTAAEARLDEARALTASAQALITAGEARYRYPAEILTQPKPDSLTSYPFGYLEETSRAYFWTRRDDQLDALIGRVFDTAVEAWAAPPDLIARTSGDLITLLVPDDELAASVLTGFIPQLLVGLGGLTGPDAPERVALAEDFNENLLPDPETETAFTGARDGAAWTGAAPVLPLVAYDASGARFGELNIVDVSLALTLIGPTGSDPDADVTGVAAGELAGELVSAELIALVRSFAGIDEEGVANLLKAVFGVPAEDPLPARLEVRFGLTFAAD